MAGSPFAAAAAAALSFLLLIPTARFVAFERRFSGDLFFAGGGSATASAEVIASSRACRRGDPRDQLMPESMTLRGSQLAPRASSEMATMDRPAPSSRPPAPRARHRRRVRSTPPTPPPPPPTPREFARCTSTWCATRRARTTRSLVPSLDATPTASADPSLTEAGLRAGRRCSAQVRGGRVRGESRGAAARSRSPSTRSQRLCSSPMRRCMLTATPVSESSWSIPIRVQRRHPRARRMLRRRRETSTGRRRRAPGPVETAARGGVPGVRRPGSSSRTGGGARRARLRDGRRRRWSACSGVADWLWREAKAWKPRRRRAHDRGARHVHRHPDARR